MSNRPICFSLSLVMLLAVGTVVVTGCGSGGQDPATEGVPSPTNARRGSLIIEDLVVGTGAEAQAGRIVTVHYTGWLTDGTKFDSSLDRGQPFVFTLGVHEVISGWDQGVAGMKEGGKRKLTIPPEMGYGPSGAGGVIPPDATLIFEVELLQVD